MLAGLAHAFPREMQLARSRLFVFQFHRHLLAGRQPKRLRLEPRDIGSRVAVGFRILRGVSDETAVDPETLLPELEEVAEEMR